MSSNQESDGRKIRVGVIAGLSITQVVLGGVCVLLGIVLLIAGCEDDVARLHGNGIWSGAFYVLTGIFGIVAAKTRHMGFVMTLMVLSIISSVLCLTTLGYGAANVDQSRDDTDYFIVEYVSCDDTAQNVSIACGTLLIIVAIAEGIIAIIAACFCMEPICCKRYYNGHVVYPTGPTVYTHAAAGYGAQVTSTTIGYGHPQVMTAYQQPGMHISVGPTTTQITQPPSYTSYNPPAYVY